MSSGSAVIVHPYSADVNIKIIQGTIMSLTRVKYYCENRGEIEGLKRRGVTNFIMETCGIKI